MACRTAPRRAASGFRVERVRIAAKPALFCAVVAVLGVATDGATKAWADSQLSDGRDITVAGGLIRLQLVINHGASFGLGAGSEALLAGVALIGVILLGIWALRAGSYAERFGASLGAAGAVGNLIDRLTRAPAPLHGGVVDWLHVSFYAPTFNLADVWLRGGVLIALAGWLWRHRRSASSGVKE